MEIISKTERGCFSKDKIISQEKTRIRTILRFDWPFATGSVELSKDIQCELLSENFLWASERGFIEEDATILTIMLSQGYISGKSKSLSLRNIKFFPTFVQSGSFVERFSKQEDLLKKYYFRNYFPALDIVGRQIYPIIDNLSHLNCLLDVGAEMIQIRIKNKNDTEVFNVLEQAVKITERYPSVKLFINDYWQSAIELGVYGVHLGQTDLVDADLKKISDAGLRLGLSTHSFWEVSFALKFYPSYIACGPVFPTRVKSMPWVPQTETNLDYWCKLLPVPVVGIGGINYSNLEKVRQTQVRIISLISAITNSASPSSEYIKYKNLWET